VTDRYAFVGDVHGNLDALRGILKELVPREGLRFVFLGDYLNKGPYSAEVLEHLLKMKRAGEATLLAGNHEAALLQALDTADLTSFIKMGGAATIRSYLRRPVGPDVLDDFRANLPTFHVEGLREMPCTWETADVIARHAPADVADTRFTISAHIPVGPLPRITATTAQLDTGSGSGGHLGRLTAFLWPSRDFVQVDAAGRRVPRERQP
jgi:serine/threonine protein phosphatase 1